MQDVRVIIPTFHRPRRLTRCLDALSRQSYPRDHFEVIVVDDGSGAPPRAEVETASAQLDVDLVEQPHAGPAAARNTGAATASAALLAFTDDDCEPEPDWLERLEAASGGDPARVVGGLTINALGDNHYAAASHLVVERLLRHLNSSREQARFLASNNLAIPRELFETVGGFDDSYRRPAAEDRDFCDKLLHSGARLSFVAEAQVLHSHDLDLPSFWRQHFNYGQGAFLLRAHRRQRYHEPLRLEPASFYRDLLLAPLRNGTSERRASAALLVLLSQVATAAGFAWRGLGDLRGPAESDED